MFCSNCGKELDENAKFCPECGTSVSNIETVNNSKVSSEGGTSVSNIETEDNSKVSPEDGSSVSNTETEDDAEKDNVSDKSKDKKSSWGGLIIATLIFAWNSYVILHNFCVHDGYFWAILAIIVNAGIIFSVPDMISKLLPKFNPKIGYAVFGAIFLIGAIIGYKPFETYIEESSVEIVNNILEENWGAGAAECTRVTILKETGKNTYKGKAKLDDGDTLDVNIEYYKKTKQIEVEILY